MNEIIHPIEPLNYGQLAQLFADLNPARISQRKQGGANLSYLEAWDIRASLNRVFGFGGWSADVIPEGTRVLRFDEVPKSGDRGGTNWRVTAQATLRLYIHQLGATYTETAIASQTGPDTGEVGDFAIKTAESDALKRAAVNLGTTFGLSLYNKGATVDPIKVSRRDGQTPADLQLLQAESVVEKGNVVARIARLQSDAQISASPSSTAGQAPAEPEPTLDPETGEVIDDQGQAAVLDPAAVDAGRSAVADAFGGRQA